MDEICLFPGCDHEVLSRGLCRTHYQNAHRLIKEGRTTWDILVANGKALPKGKTKKGVTQFFLEEEPTMKMNENTYEEYIDRITRAYNDWMQNTPHKQPTIRMIARKTGLDNMVVFEALQFHPNFSVTLPKGANSHMEIGDIEIIYLEEEEDFEKFFEQKWPPVEDPPDFDEAPGDIESVSPGVDSQDEEE